MSRKNSIIFALRNWTILENSGKYNRNLKSPKKLIAEIKEMYEGTKCYFPLAYEPKDDTSIVESQEAFATAMLKGTTPTKNNIRTT